MFDFQAMLDGMGAKMQRERAGTQITLGRLINALEMMPDESMVANLRDAHSYRGYYCDIAFELVGGKRPAKGLLKECKDAMGQVFVGYKGGDYVMGALTPVWIANYGECGKKLISIDSDGEIEVENDE